MRGSRKTHRWERSGYDENTKSSDIFSGKEAKYTGRVSRVKHSSAGNSLHFDLADSCTTGYNVEYKRELCLTPKSNSISVNKVSITDMTEPCKEVCDKVRWADDPPSRPGLRPDLYRDKPLTLLPNEILLKILVSCYSLGAVVAKDDNYGIHDFEEARAHLRVAADGDLTMKRCAPTCRGIHALTLTILRGRQQVVHQRRFSYVLKIWKDIFHMNIELGQRLPTMMFRRDW